MRWDSRSPKMAIVLFGCFCVQYFICTKNVLICIKRSINFCRTLALLGYSARSVKWVPTFLVELALKLRVYVLSWLAVVCDCTGARTENNILPDVLDTNSIDACIAYMFTSPAPHLGLCTPWRARYEKQQKSHWLFALEYAKFSLQEKWNNCPHPYRTVGAERTKHVRLPRIHLLAWRSCFTGGM